MGGSCQVHTTASLLLGNEGSKPNGLVLRAILDMVTKRKIPVHAGTNTNRLTTEWPVTGRIINVLVGDNLERVINVTEYHKSTYQHYVRLKATSANTFTWLLHNQTYQW